MRRRIGLALVALLVFVATFLRPQPEIPEEIQRYSYAQVVEALSEAGLEAVAPVAGGTTGERSLGIPAREYHHLVVGQGQIDLWILHDGDAVEEGDSGLVVHRSSGGPVAIPGALLEGERYTMHKGNLLVLLQSEDPSEVAQMIHALARIP